MDRVEVKFVYECPNTHEQVELESPDVEVGGFCADEEYPHAHYVSFWCPKCRQDHLLYGSDK